MVDENGEPLVVYHGGAKGFNVFENAKSRLSNPENSPEQNLNTVTPYGWFRDAKKYADVFGRTGETKAVLVNIRNPLIISSWSELEKWAGKAIEYRKRLKLSDLPTRGLKLREYLKDEFGYDGIIMKDTDTDGHLGGVDKKSFYIPFGKSSSQIKSADPVTYDDAGIVIPLSERFNLGNNDIRHSIHTTWSPNTFRNRAIAQGVARGGRVRKEALGTSSSVQIAPFDERNLSPENERVRHSLIIGTHAKMRRNLDRVLHFRDAMEMLPDYDEYNDQARSDIYAKTGWWKGVDGMWRVEIPSLKPKARVGQTARERNFGAS